VRWKPFQERLPTREELTGWFGQWPQAGLALVLGPVSNAFVLDVDGPDAHAVLMERLEGVEPRAPKALSGSGKPCRYHLFFRDPELPTRAKQTPWHPQLEFRGRGGIVIIPPSLHKSGKRYAWAPGRSPNDLALPDVPSPIRDALAAAASRRRPTPRPCATTPVSGVNASPSTLSFLSGRYKNGPFWNDRLFNAACDLHGRGLPLAEAEPLLLTGAAPWNQDEEELARRTIQSAYEEPRVPALF
jgi:hypothetical protein